MSLESVTTAPLRRLVAQRDLRLLLAAGLVSQTGDWVLSTGIAYQVYVLTRSTVVSALVLLATRLPQVVVGPLAGVLADRFERRRVMVVVDVLLGLAVLPLVLVDASGRVWVVYVVMLACGALTPLFTAAQASLLPALVEGPDLQVGANALNGQVTAAARLVGAALGGVLAASGGPAVLAVGDAASFAVAAVLISLIHHRPAAPAAPPASSGGRHPRLLGEAAEGLAIIRASRTLLVVVAFFAATGVGEGTMGTLFAPFVRHVVHAGATAYGLVLAAQAVGGLVGGAAVTVLGQRLAPRLLFGAGALAFGLLDVALFCYPLALGGTWPAIAVMTLVGIAAAALTAGLFTVFQHATAPSARGRVFASATTAQNAGILAAAPLAGALAAHLGVQPVITAQGVLYAAAGAAVLVALRERTTRVDTSDRGAGTSEGTARRELAGPR